MTTYSVWQRTIVDNYGNVLPSATVEVRTESGNTLATLKLDRTGSSGVTNPFVADGGGFAQFYLAAGSYKITATSGSFSQTWRHVAIGTAQEIDIESLAGLAGMRYTHTHSSDNPPGIGRVTSDNSILSSSTTSIYFSSTDGNDNDQHDRLISFDDSTSVAKGVLTFRSSSGAEMSYSVAAITDYEDASPALASVGMTVSFLSGEALGDVFEDDSDLFVEFSRTGDKGDQGIQGIQGVKGDQGIQGPAGSGGGLGGSTPVTVSSDIDITDSYNQKLITCESSSSPPSPVALTFVKDFTSPWCVVVKNQNCPYVSLIADNSSPPSYMINAEAQIDLLINEWALVWADGSGNLVASITREMEAPAVVEGGMSDVERQNFGLSLIYQAKSFADYRRLVNVFADGYKSSNGIAAGSSSNYFVDTTNGRVEPTTSGTTVTIGTRSSDTSNAWTYANLTTAVVNSVTVAKIGFHSASAGSATIKIVKRNSPGNFDVVYSQAVSHSGSGGWEDFELTTPYAVPGSGSYYIAVFNTSGNLGYTGSVSRAYNTSDLAVGTGYTFTEDTAATVATRYTHSVTPNNMTVVTTAQTTDSTVTKARALIEYDPVDAITLNTDLTIDLTCNGGTNWTAATLSAVTVNSQAGRDVAETAEVTCTGGTSFQARIKNLNNKNVRPYGLKIEVSA